MASASAYLSLYRSWALIFPACRRGSSHPGVQTPFVGAGEKERMPSLSIRYACDGDGRQTTFFAETSPCTNCSDSRYAKMSQTRISTPTRTDACGGFARASDRKSSVRGLLPSRMNSPGIKGRTTPLTPCPERTRSMGQFTEEDAVPASER